MVYFDELLMITHADHVHIALVLTTEDCGVINLTHSENVALSHHSVKNLKCECIYEVKHLFLSADEK